MKLEALRIPPVSKEFFERLVLAYPPIREGDIREGVSEIKIHRKAAQQEVIEFIRNAVVKSYSMDDYKPLSIKDRIKFVLFNRIGE